MDLSTISFAKLTGASNYKVWSIKMKALLISQDLWDVTDSSPTKSPSASLKSQNSKAVSMIILCCEDHIVRLLDPDDLAASAWKKLEHQYGQIGFSARHLAFQSLVSTQISSCENIDQFIDQFRSNITTLSQMSSATLPQWLLLSILINNVGSKYEAWSQSIMQQVRLKSISEDSYHYLDEVIASLIDESRRINQYVVNESNIAMTAVKSQKTKPICKHCGKIHKSDNCWQKYPEKRPSARISLSNRDSSKRKYKYQFTNSKELSSPNQKKHWDSWIVDSGATQHMCKDKSKFINFKTYSTSITIANNTRMRVAGKGDILITPRRGKAFTLLNVLYVPQLASNLLSVSYAMKNPDIRFKFIGGACKIIFKDNIIATATSKSSQSPLLILDTAEVHAHPLSSKTNVTSQSQFGLFSKVKQSCASVKPNSRLNIHNVSNWRAKKF